MADEQDLEPAHTLTLAPSVRWLPSSSDALFGVVVGWQWLRLGASVHALFNRAGDDLGTTTFGLVHAVASYQLLRLRLGRQVMHAGPALGAGITWASAGTSATANGGSALLASYELGAQLGIDRQLSSTLAGGITLAGGYARGPKLRADDRDLATLAGPFLGVALRMSFGLSAAPAR